jgi:hypothetical protein
MQIIIAIVCLGLLMRVEPANAQDTKTYELTVGHHEALTLRSDRVDDILAEASKVLQKCNVILKRKGSVGTFRSPNQDARVTTDTERDAVHRENFDLKVVRVPFDFCRIRDVAAFFGCAWDPPPPPQDERPQHRSIIAGVSRDNLKHTGVTWAHEFGHKQGLPHRNERKALMRCKVEVENVELNEKECECLRRGTGHCNDPPEPPTQCARGR